MDIYVNASGQLRLGSLFQDLDALAGVISYKVRDTYLKDRSNGQKLTRIPHISQHTGTSSKTPCPLLNQPVLDRERLTLISHYNLTRSPPHNRDRRRRQNLHHKPPLLLLRPRTQRVCFLRRPFLNGNLD